MPTHKYDCRLAVSETTHTMVKALAKASGKTIDQVIRAGLWAIGPAANAVNKTAARDLDDAIRVRMNEKAGKANRSRMQSPIEQGLFYKGSRVDHSHWDFSVLKIDGRPLGFDYDLVDGIRGAARRYASQAGGFAFQIVKRKRKGYLFRVAQK